jgi:hypothetical protein
MSKTKLFSFLLMASVAVTPALRGGTILTATLQGGNEVPPNASTGSGFITVTLDTILNQLTVDESFTGLTNPATGAHIHCCAPIGTNAIVAVPFTGFPSATSGIYMQTFDLTLASSYTAAFVTANGGTAASAEAALVAALLSGNTYANIHDATFPGGEIRGQLVATPEPGTAMLLLAGLVPVVMLRRKLARYQR